jgi:predicted metal-binding protein
MDEPVRIGIIICHRYQHCAGGKCFRALRNREGAFAAYKDQQVELVGYTTCGGCPGGNFEYAPDELKRNGARIVHLATGLVVGYPPCPYLFQIRDFLQQHHDMNVVIGTHPIPRSYYTTHLALGTWKDPVWDTVLPPLVGDEISRDAYS